MSDVSAIPVSKFASPEAANLYAIETGRSAPSLNGDVQELRNYYDELEYARYSGIRSQFKVSASEANLADIPVRIVVPHEGIDCENSHRVLINLHGGAFMWGWEYGSLIESNPISATGRIKVISVNYRLAPENHFPAGCVDAAAVYAELLNEYDPSSIGVYGTSAGGVLTAQLIGWLDRSGLPLPGAIGTFCATGLELGGDSSQLYELQSGKSENCANNHALRLSDLPYFRGTSADDPLVFPLQCDKILRRFPPTLLIAGGRDFAASSLTQAHRKLTAAGRRSQLYLFDGLWHAFLSDPRLPESSEAYELIARFFATHLR